MIRIAGYLTLNYDLRQYKNNKENISDMKKANKRIKPEEYVAKCQEFFTKFQDYDIEAIPAYGFYGNHKYLIKIQQIADGVTDRFEILFEDLEAFFRKDDEKEMLLNMKTNTSRYIEIFTEVINKMMPDQIQKDEADKNEIKNRLANILNEQRKQNLRNNIEAGKADHQSIPKKMFQNFDVAIIYGPGSKLNIETISDFNSDKIGSMVACKAIVVRATEVKPEITVATYTCDNCGFENYIQVFDDTLSYMTKCNSTACVENKMNGQVTFLPGHSKFISYQEIKIQETPDQLKQGQIPKHFTVRLRGNLVKSASPGDIILVQGILQIHKRKTKYDNDILFDCHLEASQITREKKKYVEMNLTEDNIAEIGAAKSKMNDDEIFQKMAKSIAPEIYGLMDVKKALLLLMAGGVTKVTNDNMKIRGQINIALFGDPGIAKSQLLKHISYIAPRGVYTTGKGSSGVGLTAAIVKDPFTQQLALEAGALVLADMGVCCIDEFDKMDEKDRTAIHQVMEQQTVSIAKAGITTSLNARTSVLAAANPLYGRYNKTVSTHKNINLPAALLSRFDLIFILLDTAQFQKDRELSQHINLVHQQSRSPDIDRVFSSDFVRAYIAKSKQYEPTISEELHEQIISRYLTKRKEQMDLAQHGQNYTTMRSLLALIRLSQARARLRFSNQVSKSDVADCLELIEESQRSAVFTRIQRKRELDEKTVIYEIIKSICNYTSIQSADYQQILKRVISRGHSQAALQNTIKQYEELNIIMRKNNQIIFI